MRDIVARTTVNSAELSTGLVRLAVNRFTVRKHTQPYETTPGTNMFETMLYGIEWPEVLVFARELSGLR